MHIGSKLYRAKIKSVIAQIHLLLQKTLGADVFLSGIAIFLRIHLPVNANIPFFLAWTWCTTPCVLSYISARAEEWVNSNQNKRNFYFSQGSASFRHKMIFFFEKYLSKRAICQKVD